jgi:hypothetical protein
MWIMINDCFVSIVNKDCARDELMVRARRPGDIEKLFPNVVVTEYTASDYHYRAAIKRDAIAAALVSELGRVTYSNFKDSVVDRPLHDAYLQVWSAMARLQPKRPYSGAGNRSTFDFGEHFGTTKPKAQPKKKQDAQASKNLKKLTRGQ